MAASLSLGIHIDHYRIIIIIEILILYWFGIFSAIMEFDIKNDNDVESLLNKRKVVHYFYYYKALKYLKDKKPSRSCKR